MPYAARSPACSTCVLPSRFLFRITAEGRQTREGRGGGGTGEGGGLQATGLSREGRVGVSVEGGGGERLELGGGGGGGCREGWGLK